MNTHTISVAHDFSRFPAGILEGDANAERFRRLVLTTLSVHPHVTIELDGTIGYGSNWLYAVFSWLADNVPNLRTRLVIHSEADPSLVIEAWSYVGVLDRQTHNYGRKLGPLWWDYNLAAAGRFYGFVLFGVAIGLFFRSDVL